MRFKVRFGLMALGISGAGCALHEVAPKAPELPAAFENRSTENAQAWPSQDWYKGFGNSELHALIDQAARSNLALTMALARVKPAYAGAGLSRAAISAGGVYL